MKNKQVIDLLNSSAYLSVGFDVADGFAWMSIALLNKMLDTRGRIDVLIGSQ